MPFDSAEIVSIFRAISTARALVIWLLVLRVLVVLFPELVSGRLGRCVVAMPVILIILLVISVLQQQVRCLYVVAAASVSTV